MKSKGSFAQLFSTLNDFNTRKLDKALSRLSANRPPREFMYESVLPLMREVGLRWHTGRLAVAHEHLVSQVLRSTLGSLLPSVHPLQPSTRMLLSTPANELHEFGTLLAAVFASIAGIEPVYLGPNLCANEIVYAAKHAGARTITLGVTVKDNDIQTQVAEIIGGMPSTTTLWLGGPGARAVNLSAFKQRARKIRSFQQFEISCSQL